MSTGNLLQVMVASPKNAMPARISHQFSAEAKHPGMSTALRSVGFLDVPSSTPAESCRRAPWFHARLRCLATKSGEKCGLAVEEIVAPAAAGGAPFGSALCNDLHYSLKTKRQVRERKQDAEVQP